MLQFKGLPKHEFTHLFDILIGDQPKLKLGVILVNLFATRYLKHRTTKIKNFKKRMEHVFLTISDTNHDLATHSVLHNLYSLQKLYRRPSRVVT